MLGLADALRDCKHSTIFLCNDSRAPLHLGHQLVEVRKWSPQVDPKVSGKQEEGNSMVRFGGVEREEFVFLGDERLSEKWSQMVDLLDLNVCSFHHDQASISDEQTVKALEHNYSLLKLTLEAEIASLHEKIEDILINLKPDLVVVDGLGPQPAVWRLSNENYAKSRGLPKALSWISLTSCNPMPLYYSFALERGFLGFPPPLRGLSLKLCTGVHLEVEQLKYERILKGSGIVDEMAKLAGLSGINPLENPYDFSKFMRNESPQLNIYMFPRQLDYAMTSNLESGIKSKLELPSNYLRVDSLTRSCVSGTSNKFLLAPEDESLLAKLTQWRQMGDLNSRIIYVSLGTTISCNLVLMESLLNQVFHCLEMESDWRFALALGSRCKRLPESIWIKLTEYESKFRLVHSSWWPQPELFRRQLIDACVSHGGNNTLCELFQFNIRHLVLVAGFHDQVDNARRVADLQMGVALSVQNFLPAPAASSPGSSVDSGLNSNPMVKNSSPTSENLGKKKRGPGEQVVSDDLLLIALRNCFKLDATRALFVASKNSTNIEGSSSGQLRATRLSKTSGNANEQQVAAPGGQCDLLPVARDARYCAQIIERNLLHLQ